MSSESIIVEKNGAVATLSFNRPAEMNTYNIQMSEELPRAVTKLKNDHTVRVVCLQGQGPVFMAGGDVRFFAEHISSSLPEKILPLARALHTAVIDLQSMAKPVVAKVHGAVAGAGLSLMCAADLVIAASKTTFSLAYTHLGLSADGGASYFLPRHLGSKKAMELMLLADRFDAESAREMGLINWIVPEQQLEAHTQQLLAKLAAGPSRAYAEIKALMHKTWDNSLETQLELEAKSMSELTGTADFARGVKAFISKEPALFQGN